MKRVSTTVGLMAVTLITAGMADPARAIDITTARAGGDGQLVTLDNVIVSNDTDLIGSSSSKNIQVQDATGGITVFGTNAVIDALGVVAGDQITITGYTDSYNGLFELVDQDPGGTAGFLSVVTNQGNVGIPTPADVTAADFQNGSLTAEGFESELVKLTGVSFVDAGSTFAGFTNYNVTDGVNTVSVRVSTNDLDLVGQTIPAGTLDIVGIFSQFDSSSPYDAGYQLLIRSTSDIVQSGGNFAPSATGQEVLINKGAASIPFTLQATDADGGPFPVSYAIAGGSASPVGPTLTGGAAFGGSLVDPNDCVTPGDLNTCTDVTSGGALSTNEVTFIPDPGASGWFEFIFQANDGADVGEATITILIQDSGRIVITEIMYDPANLDDNDWEWIEVQNQTASPITLNAIFDETLDLAHEFNMFGLQIPGSGTDDGLAIIAPESNGSRTVAEFATEWGISAGQILTYLVPADPAQPPIFRNDMDTIYLFDDAGALLDVVNYENDANGWPASNNRGSIFLEFDQIDTVANDDGANWNLSVGGANGVFATPEEPGPPTDSDEGSPMFVPDAPTVQADPPNAAGQEILTSLASEPLTITLDATDPTQDPLEFIIMGEPVGFGPTPDTTVGGTLTDPNGGLIGAFPYTLQANGNQVEFSPTASGQFAFGFRANDGSSDSNIAYVEILVQGGQVVMTEIMYNPRNIQDSDYEYLEIHNPTGAAVNLGTFWDANKRDDGVNILAGNSLAAGETKIIVRGDTADRTVTQFISEWAPATLSASDVITIPEGSWPFLNNGGDQLYLFAFDGSLLDAVFYETSSPWPVDDGESSIFLKNGSFTAAANDDPANWLLSQAGIEDAVQSFTGGADTTFDVGSPAILAPGNNFPPAVGDVSVATLIDTPVTITLAGSDDGFPAGTLEHVIETLPAGGALSDPNGGVIASVPYTLLNEGDQVIYTPAPGVVTTLLGGPDTFEYSAFDGQDPSTVNGIVDVSVQKGGLVISEIMYNPRNHNLTTTSAEDQWEWVEITNISGADITLAMLTDDDAEPDGNLVVNTLIPAGTTVVVAQNEAIVDTRTNADFLAEWFNLSGTQVLFVGDSATWEVLSNSGDHVQIYDGDGDLHDDVFYDDFDPWPVDDGFASIYVLSGFIDALSNDAGVNWALSVDGVDNAYQTPTIAGGGATDDQDVGSPGALPGAVGPPALVYAASRKLHGGVADYDIELFPAPTVSGVNTIGVECRDDGVIDRLVLEFDGPAGLTCGELSVTVPNDNSVTCTGVTDLGGNTYEVALAGGVDESCLEVQLTGLGGEIVQGLNIRGDANASAGVTIADLSAVKFVNQQGGVIDAANARTDINLSNGVTIADLSAAKASSGGTASCP